MNAPHIVRKAVSPTTAPTEAGIHWIDTVLKKHFFSVGTDTVADWIELGSGGGTSIVNGTATLVAGTVTINTVSITAISRVFAFAQETGNIIGTLKCSARTPGVSFTLLSTYAGDDAEVAWMILEP